MARMVVNLHITPEQYWALTVAEHAAIVTEWNRANRKGG